MPARRLTAKVPASSEKARTARQDTEALPEPIGGLLAEEFIAVLITTIATRLSRGSTHFYRTRWDIGMLEWRLLLVLERTDGLNGSELGNAAGLDKAAVSRSLANLQERNLVTVEQTRSRGRAAFAALTPAGKKTCREILSASRRRQQGLFKVFPKADNDALAATLRRFAQALDEVGWDASPQRRAP